MLRKALVALLLVPVLSAGYAANTKPDAAKPKQELLSFRYEKPTSPDFDSLSNTLRESRILEVWIKHIGNPLRGTEVRIETVMAECGKADSSYEPEKQRITLCYEEIDRIFATLRSLGYENDRLLVFWIGTMLNELYHELCHGLIHTLTLPVAGKEEDACDQFALLGLLNHPHGTDLALGSIVYLGEMSGVEKEIGVNPSQQHSSYAQRYFNILCWTYGSDPEKLGFLIDQERLPEARARTCRIEYLRAVHAWEALLAPFGK